MVENRPPLSEQTVRIRRNLLVFSLLILFKEYSGIELKEINILGNVFVVKEPFIIDLSLYIIHFYFLVRFFQYIKIVEKYHPLARLNERMTDYLLSRQSMEFKKNGTELSHYTISINRLSFLAYGWKKNKKIISSRNEVGEEGRVRIGDILASFVKIIMEYIIFTTQFFDIVVPFIVAFFVYAFGVYLHVF